MTWFDVVREYFPNASKEECDFILWEKTAYPACGLDTVRKQLREFKEYREKLILETIKDNRDALSRLEG